MTKKRLFNDGWTFLKQPLNTKIEDIRGKEHAFYPVNIPHDWLIYQAENLYESATGWYRKCFTCKKQKDIFYEIYFEGVYMDTTVYLNGQVLGEWKYGYSSSFFDMTSWIKDGENELLVRVNYQSPNSRWYSGAGIYRNVYVREHGKTHFATDSLYIVPEKNADGWKVTVSAQLEDYVGKNVLLQIMDAKGNIIASKEGKAAEHIRIMTLVEQPELWTLESPALYICSLSVIEGVQILDVLKEKFGFRTFSFDHEQGFFLNDMHVKLNGVCEHHDFGALGAAFYKEAMRRKLEILKTMGVNSIRSTHNMPAVELLELCDEMGFLVIDEAFDMWERPKTTYDYARFFSEWYKKDVRSWICRDRNHPCILFWSIGNEIYDTHADERGQEITKLLMEEVRKYDPEHHAEITIGSNYMPWENAQKCADILKFAGYNYGEKYYDEHHKKYSDWYIYGSETASTVQSRGIYHFPYRQSVLADEDEQCSSLGNSTTSWGASSSEMCIITERDRPFSMGQFLWSGFDYIGEPTPYHTRNSYFGQIDTAGFPKDSFYIYRSAWTDAEKNPFVHVFPYWDFNEGQLIDVRVATNASIVSLWLNGICLGEKEIDHEHAEVLTADWQIPYKKGELTAVAYDKERREVARETKHSFGEPVKLVMELYKPDKAYTAGIYDLAFVTVSAVDEKGYPVENANNLVHVFVDGAGWLTGLDNGDSTDTEEYKGYIKRLFNGKMLAVIAIGKEKGKIAITAKAEGLEKAVLTFEVSKQESIEGISLIPEVFIENKQKEDNWIRKIELTTQGTTVLNPDTRQIMVKAETYPANRLVQSLDWKTVNDAGIESPLAKVTRISENTAMVEACGDGSFRLRCMTRNGTDKVKVISQLEFNVEGMGYAYLNPYGFIPGGMYTYTEGEVGNGNEHGVSTARDGRTVVGFEHIDFGSFGSDTITLPVFELGGEKCPIEIWEGVPQKEGSTLLASVIYHKPSIWNEYQPETYQLIRRVKGITGIYFVLHQKIHLKGFSFTPLDKAYEKLYAAEADAIYGDSFQIVGKEVRNIGNNVTLEFTDMDFSAECSNITICGRTHNDKDTIHIIFKDGTGQKRQLVEFINNGSGEYQEMNFNLTPVSGKTSVSLVFLPGSCFDLNWLRFQ